MSALVRVEGLKKHFPIQTGFLQQTVGWVKAVDGVSFSIEQGETFGLIGESGSGKTTVALTLVGLYFPTEGRILFRGQDLFGSSSRRDHRLRMKKEIQLVFQDPGSSLNPRRTIRQALEVPLRVHKLCRGRNQLRQRVASLLELVGLPAEYMYKYPSALSGGQKQRVAIARALAVGPSFVILDEPTSALDVSVQGKIIKLLMDLQQRFHLSYLFTSHDLSLMRNVASRVAVMYLGKISELAPTAKLFQNPLHPYTQMLLSAIPVVSEAEERLRPPRVITQGEIPDPAAVPSGCSFHPRCPMKIEICSRVDPLMTEVEPGHFVRCHLYYKHEQQ